MYVSEEIRKAVLTRLTERGYNTGLLEGFFPGRRKRGGRWMGAGTGMSNRTWCDIGIGSAAAAGRKRRCW
jgi:hypothetical protein